VEIVQVVSFLEEASRSSRNAIALLTQAMILATGSIILIVSALGLSRSIEDLVSSIRVVGSVSLAARRPRRQETHSVETRRGAGLEFKNSIPDSCIETRFDP
jgi:hypothetical protein